MTEDKRTTTGGASTGAPNPSGGSGTGAAGAAGPVSGEAVRAKALRTLIAGLRNAHAVEKQSAATLRPQIDRLANYPELQKRIRQHLDETYEQEKRLEIVLRKLDSSPSMLKDITLSLMGSGQQGWQSLADDTPIKATLADSMVEHFEVATYRALFTLADLAGEKVVGEDLAPSLREEEAMAAWLDEHLPAIVRAYVEQEVVEDRAEKKKEQKERDTERKSDGIPGWLRSE